MSTLFSRSLPLAALLLLVGPRSGGADELPPALRSWIDNEQQLNSRQVDLTRIVALDNHQNKKYAPETGRTFEVKSYWVDAKRLHAFTGEGMASELQGQLFRTVKGRPQVRLLVHPESEAFYSEFLRDATAAPSFRATATASSRTLLVWPKGHGDQAFFAKLSLDKEVGGVVRTIPKGEVARSVGFNNALHSDGKDLPSSFRFLPEVMGAIPKDMERGGMIIQSIPEDIRTGERRYVPLFSLYAKRPNGAPPLIAEMIEASGLPPQKFVRDKIIRPFVAQWLELVVQRGISMEPHAQNVLIEVGKNGQPTGGFLHRDMGGFNLDFKYRKNLSIPKPRDLPVIGSMEKDYYSKKCEKNLRNLETYFVGGFVYNLDQELPKLQARWAGSSPLKPDTFSKMMIREVEMQASKRLGYKVSLGKDLSLVPSLVLESREGYRASLLKSRASTGLVSRWLRSAARKTVTLLGHHRTVAVTSPQPTTRVSKRTAVLTPPAPWKATRVRTAGTGTR